MEANPWKTLSKRPIYDNPWIAVEEHQVINPSGGNGIYGTIHFKHRAMAILPLDDEGNTWLVGQYRYILQQYSWEIPEGGGPLDEDPLAAAQRELREETGIVAKRWTKILDMHLSNSVSDETAVGFVAQDLSFESAQPDDTEQLQVKKIPFQEVWTMVMNGEITDALTIAMVLKVAQLPNFPKKS